MKSRGIELMNAAVSGATLLGLVLTNMTRWDTPLRWFILAVEDRAKSPVASRDAPPLAWIAGAAVNIVIVRFTAECENPPDENRAGF
jgi:hypothetical protein